MLAPKDVQALKRQLFSFQPATVFAVLDGASVPDLPAQLASFAPEYRCLFRGALEPEMAEVAPYLVLLEHHAPFTDWLLLNGWGRNWGIFGISQADIRVLGRHLRRFVQIYSDGKPLYFRYYDPRVMRNYLPTCTLNDLRNFFGPVMLYLLEDYNSQLLRRFAIAGEGLVEDRSPLPGLPPFDADLFTAAFAAGETTAGTGSLVVRPEQLNVVGERIYVERMRAYLNEFFQESMDVPPEEMKEIILELTDRAAGYKLVLETHVAPFIVAAWIFGTNFDEEFLTVKEVLQDYEMDCGLKAQWLWDFIDVTLEILEDGQEKTD